MGDSNQNNQNTPTGGGSPSHGQTYATTLAYGGTPGFPVPPPRGHFGVYPHHSSPSGPLPPVFNPPAPAAQITGLNNTVTGSFETSAVSNELLKDAIESAENNPVYFETTAHGQSLVIPVRDKNHNNLGVVYTASTAELLLRTDDGIMVAGKTYKAIKPHITIETPRQSKSPPAAAATKTTTTGETVEYEGEKRHPTKQGSLKRSSSSVPTSGKSDKKAKDTPKKKKKKRDKKKRLPVFAHAKVAHGKFNRKDRASRVYTNIYTHVKFERDQSMYRFVQNAVKEGHTNHMSTDDRLADFEKVLKDDKGNHPIFVKCGGTSGKLTRIAFREFWTDLPKHAEWFFESLQVTLENEGRDHVTADDVEKLFRLFISDAMSAANITTFAYKQANKKNKKHLREIEEYLPVDPENVVDTEAEDNGDR
jgi:hypothetical protein